MSFFSRFFGSTRFFSVSVFPCPRRQYRLLICMGTPLCTDTRTHGHATQHTARSSRAARPTAAAAAAATAPALLLGARDNNVEFRRQF